MSTFSNLIVKEPMDEEVSLGSVMNSQLKVKTAPGGDDEVFQLQRKVEEVSKRLFLLEDFIQVEFSHCDERLTAFSLKRDTLIGLGFGESASNISEGIRSGNSKELVDILRIAKEREKGAKSATSESSGEPDPTTFGFSAPSCNKEEIQEQQILLYKDGKVLVRRHSHEDPTKCPFCPYIVSRKFLMEHLVVVHQNKPFHCTICPKTIFCREALKLHLIFEHQLERNSQQYIRICAIGENNLKNDRRLYRSWYTPLITNAIAPTPEEIEAFKRYDLEESGSNLITVPHEPTQEDILAWQKRCRSKMPLHIRKPYVCKYCGRRYFTEPPKEKHQLICYAAPRQNDESPPQVGVARNFKRYFE